MIILNYLFPTAKIYFIIIFYNFIIKNKLYLFIIKKFIFFS